jgi:hypothetical protein
MYTYVYEKRPTHETNMNGKKSPLLNNSKRKFAQEVQLPTKATYVYEKRPTKETYTRDQYEWKQISTPE